MALADTYYRVQVDNTYSSSANAISVQAAINSALSGLGRPETATQTGSQVLLLIVGLTEAQAVSIRAGILAAWTAQARTFGKVSIVRTNDLD